MPEVFLLYAVVRPVKKSLTDLFYQRLETVEQVQKDLQARFQAIQQEWSGHKQIKFSPTYTPDDDEVFFRTDFIIPDSLKKAASHRAQFGEFKKDQLDAKDLSLKAIIGIHKNLDTDKTTYYFQQTDKRHILDRKKWYPIVYMHNKYAPLDGHALTIGDHLTVIIQPDKKLLFRSYLHASQLLDLTGFFKEATDEDIKTILGCEKVTTSPEDVAKIIGLCDNLMRKRFAILQYEGTLDGDKVPAQSIVQHAKKFGINITVKGKPPNTKIVFPTDKEQLKLFLKFLCQDYYESILTGDKCVSNSHRKL